MTPSLNEIEMMVWKAARGAGLAWGLAEEMAQAARWLADHGFDWAEPLAAALAEAEQCEGALLAPVLAEDDAWEPELFDDGWSSPILCGPLLTDTASDIGTDRPLVFRRVAQPLLMLPFAAGAADEFGFGLTLRIDEARFHFDGRGGVQGAAALPSGALAERITLSMDDSALVDPAIGSLPAGAARRPIPPEPLARLEAWVHRTYVPASAESRLAGAGAGLTDND